MFSKITQLSYGVYRIGSLIVTPHDCPECLRVGSLPESFCDECDWFIPQECPLWNTLEVKRLIRTHFSDALEQERKTIAEAHMIRDAAQTFLARSSRSRHFAVIAYEINQAHPNLKVGNKKVLYALKRFPDIFVEAKAGEFKLVDKE